MAPPPEPGGIPSPQSWPAAGKGVEVHRNVLKKVAEQLQADYDKLSGEGAGTSAALVDNCEQLDTGELGNYTGGKAMAESSKKAYTAINRTYSSMLSTYKSAIDTINQTVKNYESAEDASQQTADGVKPSTNSNTKSFN